MHAAELRHMSTLWSNDETGKGLRQTYTWSCDPHLRTHAFVSLNSDGEPVYASDVCVVVSILTSIGHIEVLSVTRTVRRTVRVVFCLLEHTVQRTVPRINASLYNSGLVSFSDVFSRLSEIFSLRPMRWLLLLIFSQQPTINRPISQHRPYLISTC